MEKIKFKSISSDGKFNIITLEKSEIFLDNIQDFLVDIELDKIDKHHTYDFEDKSYGRETYYNLFYEDEKENFEVKKRKINNFKDGEIWRYHNKEIELLILFLQDEIKLVFYSNESNRKNIIKHLENFVCF